MIYYHAVWLKPHGKINSLAHTHAMYEPILTLDSQHNIGTRVVITLFSLILTTNKSSSFSISPFQTFLLLTSFKIWDTVG